MEQQPRTVMCISKRGLQALPLWIISMSMEEDIRDTSLFQFHSLYCWLRHNLDCTVCNHHRACASAKYRVMPHFSRERNGAQRWKLVAKGHTECAMQVAQLRFQPTSDSNVLVMTRKAEFWEPRMKSDKVVAGVTQFYRNPWVGRQN